MMVIYVRMGFIVFILFSFVGCGGSSKSFDSNTSVYLNSKFDDNIEKNITKYINKLEKQMDVNNLRSFVSKDKKDLFTVHRHSGGYALFDYDITGKDPVLRNIIVGAADRLIVDVIPLSQGKLIYRWAYTIYVYDYILKKMIRSYSIHSFPAVEDEIHISTDEKYFVLRSYKIDISNIYQDVSILENGIYRDDTDEVVIDSINNLIWQDNKSIAKQYVIQYAYDDINTSYDIATNYCENLILGGVANWRFPTLRDLNYLPSDIAFRHPLFKNTTTENYLFKSSTDSKNYLWKYKAHMSKVSNTWYKNFNLYGSSFEEKYHIRCVADKYK